ncbi:MAG: hypothetical protein ACD_79C00739G0013 [uncultured bacterium]|nr:MAG: hypothetical protein ACD_79C00739G0013 [uncultured bacterium]
MNEEFISPEVHKHVEEEFHKIEKTVKKNMTEEKFREKYSEFLNKVYCEDCKFRRNERCINKEVLIAFGLFNHSPLKLNTGNYITILEANKDNDCKYFKARNWWNKLGLFWKIIFIISTLFILTFSGVFAVVYSLINFITIGL